MRRHQRLTGALVQRAGRLLARLIIARVALQKIGQAAQRKVRIPGAGTSLEDLGGAETLWRNRRGGAPSLKALRDGGERSPAPANQPYWRHCRPRR